jgi:hypothetical protein
MGCDRNYWVAISCFILFFIINVIDYMKKTNRQRQDQIAQMNDFIELYKKVNGLNFSLND